MHIRRGQTILEYTVVMIIILGCLIAMHNYIKRGIQGRWKSATDDFGEQYNPNSVNSNIVYTTEGNSLSIITTENGSGQVQGVQGKMPASGQWTMRNDYSNIAENKVGNTQVGN